MKSKLASFRDILGYGFGGASYMIELSIMLSYLTLFCSDVMQMDITILGIVIAAAKVLDAITDIFVTDIADRTENRFGKYRSWLLMGIPLGVMLLLTYQYPAFLSTQVQKSLWVCVLYVLTVPIFETCYTAPLVVLNTTISSNYRDRSRLSIARAIGEAVGVLIVNYSCMKIILNFGTYKDIAGWRIMGIIMGIVVVIFSLIAFFNIKERVSIPSEKLDGSQLTLTDKLSLLRSNPPFVKTVLIVVVFMLNYYCCMSMFPYFCIYVLGHEEWYSTLMSVSALTQIPFTLALVPLLRRFEKRSIIMFGGIFLSIASLILFVTGGFAGALIFQILFGIGNAFINGLLFSLMPDLCEYTNYKKGIAAPGIFSAISTFAMKLSAAGSTLFLTTILAKFDYEGALFQQSMTTVSAIRISFGALSLVSAIITVFLALSLKELTSERVEYYQSEIRARQV